VFNRGPHPVDPIRQKRQILRHGAMFRSPRAHGIKVATDGNIGLVYVKGHQIIESA